MGWLVHHLSILLTSLGGVDLVSSRRRRHCRFSYATHLTVQRRDVPSMVHTACIRPFAAFEQCFERLTSAVLRSVQVRMSSASILSVASARWWTNRVSLVVAVLALPHGATNTRRPCCAPCTFAYPSLRVPLFWHSFFFFRGVPGPQSVAVVVVARKAGMLARRATEPHKLCVAVSCAGRWSSMAVHAATSLIARLFVLMVPHRIANRQTGAGAYGNAAVVFVFHQQPMLELRLRTVTPRAIWGSRPGHILALFYEIQCHSGMPPFGRRRCTYTHLPRLR